ncbi:cyclin-J isoform X2 [Thrips palmi]|uniref:Cyclin-J isoform X2 n=1 Tax=Thrips palmi TaxID=161013 RepID=A0A6P8YMT2_THRPL|nr:cyclin-J isoform X2 [Thrips palmi]
MSRNKLREAWPLEYAVEHHEIFREKELTRRNFTFASPQIQHRAYLVSWIRVRAEKFNLGTCTVHLSIYLLDIFMDNYNIELEKLHLVALICLQIASKFEEYDIRTPKISQLNSVANNRYSTSDFHDLEVMMLTFFDWNLNIPTAAHFAEYYSLFTVTRTDWDPTEYVSYETFWQEAQRAVKDYLELSLLDMCMIQFMPSVVACACILLARQQLRLAYRWTKELTAITKYVCDDLVLCANAILRNPNRGSDCKRKVVDSPDMGYATGGSNISTPEGTSRKRRAIREDGHATINY